MRNLKLIILLVLPILSYAQGRDYKLGEIDRSYFEMTHCPWDSSAGAFYILDYGVTRFDANFDIEFTGFVRIKILNSSEFKRADVTIPYNLNKGAPKIKAFTHNLVDGQVVTSELEKDGIFKEKVLDKDYELKFTLPNVKEGSIIEYQYTVNHGNYYRLNTWSFQTAIPVEKSEYHLYIPEWLTYQRLMTPYIPLNVADISWENATIAGRSVRVDHHHYEAWKVPAFKDEVYVASDRDVISKIDFELKTTQFPGQVIRTILPASWSEVSKKLYEEDYWNRDLQKASWSKDIQLALFATNPEMSDLEKANKLFDYVKAFEKSDEPSFTLKKALDEKKGTDTELNRLLIAMLNEAGLKAEPVRLSTRSNGMLHPMFPIVSKFNHTIARLTLGDQVYLLDASEKNSVFGVLPKYCVNGKGLVINGNEEWIDLNPYENNGESVAADFEISDDGVLVGTLQVRRKGYDAWEFDKKVEKAGKDKYKEEVVKNQENWNIEEHSIDKGDIIDTTDETFKMEVEGKVEDLGDVLYVNPFVFGQMTKNPFKTPERKYPVNWGAPESDVYYCKIKLPEGFAVESLPELFRVGLPENAGSVIYSVVENNGYLVVTYRYKMNKVEYGAEEYAYLRELHAQIVAKQAEQIVLKRL
jgi:hypothetical protein